MTDYGPLSLNVPEPAVRPGGRPDFSYLTIPEAGSVRRPEIDPAFTQDVPHTQGAAGAQDFVAVPGEPLRQVPPDESGSSGDDHLHGRPSLSDFSLVPGKLAIPVVQRYNPHPLRHVVSVAQLVELQIVDLAVVGSSPITHPNCSCGPTTRVRCACSSAG